jgi:hypothetical protein
MAKESTKVKRREDVLFRELNGEAIAYDTQANFIYVMNPTAAFIWGLCNGEYSLGDIAAALVNRYQAEAEEAYQDTLNIIGQLEQFNLLEAAP